MARSDRLGAAVYGSANMAAQSFFMLTTVQLCSAAVSSDFSAPPV
jgi:hypothetical protein